MLEFELWYTRTARMDEEFSYNKWKTARLGWGIFPIFRIHQNVLKDNYTGLGGEKTKVFDLGEKQGIIPLPPPPPSPSPSSSSSKLPIPGGKRKSKKSKKNRRTSKKNRRTSKKGTKRSYKK